MKGQALILFCALSSGIGLASAQEQAKPARPAPLDAKAAVPPVVYRSAFEGYRPLADQAVTPWKAANDTVKEIGGWQAYAREAQGGGSDKDPKPAVPPSTKPAAPAGHEGHKSK